MSSKVYVDFRDIETMVRNLRKHDARYIAFEIDEPTDEDPAMLHTYARLHSNPLFEYDCESFDAVSVPEATGNKLPDGRVIFTNIM